MHPCIKKKKKSYWPQNFERYCIGDTCDIVSHLPLCVCVDDSNAALIDAVLPDDTVLFGWNRPADPQGPGPQRAHHRSSDSLWLPLDSHCHNLHTHQKELQSNLP